MNFFEILRLAYGSLRANPMRSLLTMLGITVGVFSVIGVMTFVDAIKLSVEKGFSRLGANTVQISLYPQNTMTGSRERTWREPISYRSALRAREFLEEDYQVSIHDDVSSKRVTYLDRKTSPTVSIIGVDDNYLVNQNYSVAKGRRIESDDVEQLRLVCVLGADVVEALFPGEEALGREVTADGRVYTVIGVLASKGSTLGRSLDDLVLIPISRWLTSYQKRDGSVVLSVQTRESQSLDEMVDRVIGVMRQVRGLGPEDVNDFAVTTNESTLEQLASVSSKIATGAFVISAIALLAAGVGVMNIMLVSVVERTKEIGVRKSLGAKKVHILRQFLLEAVVLTLLGGLMGVALGVVGGNLVALLMGMVVKFPWAWAVIGMSVCGGIGVAFGIYPAWRAASLDPIEALRHE